MRIKVVSLLKWSMLIIFILNYSLFYLVDIPDGISPVLGSWNKGLVGILSTILCLLCMMISPELRRKSFLILYSLTCLVSVVIVGLSTTESTWFYIVKDCFQFFLILFSIVAYCYMSKTGTVFGIMDLMNNISFIWYAIILLQEVIYPATGNYFLNYPWGVRNGFLRIDLECFGNILVLYNFYVVFYGKSRGEVRESSERSGPSIIRKPINVINLILGLIGVYLFQQTRTFVMIITIGIILQLLFVKGNIKTGLKSFIILLALIIIALNTDVVDSFFSRISTKEYSFRARSYAIDYYLSVFKRNPLTGFGFARTLNVVRGSQNMASASDVGIIGQMATMGIFSFVIMIPFVVRMIKTAIKAYRYDRERGYLIWSFVYYIIATSGTLIVLDSPRLLLWPILVAITEREMDIVNEIQYRTSSNPNDELVILEGNR